ncbi:MULTISPECIES: MarR family transcriptional regulator [unclassified Tardiphaga]|jgi:DNA-binding MarR family transcriptional regulator|uniref:MarR family winged helix-turn-helix transcriptional regulator n=1 Tax=unclassified Tardiphaga TaxID=2631404 RepID=UPI000B798811|nr:MULTISPECIES: MarR family transcriptional regulator [unclassified Tardiphaga]
MPGFLIRRCNQVAMAIFIEETAEYDLSPAQYGALGLIAAEPGLDQTRLTHRSGLDRSSVTKCVERLETRGAIRREADLDDRRARRLYPTENGLKLLGAIEASVVRAQERVLAPLGKERAEQFLSMLVEIASSNNATSRVPMRAVYEDI